MSHYFINDENLKSEIKELKFNIENYSLKFLSDNGVFSKDKIDFGSRLLLEEYLKQNKEKLEVLDLGCGYGILGISISKITDSFITLTDVNERCIDLTQKNIELNQVKAEVIKSNIYENVTKKYDRILTNPPIRAGKAVVETILIEAKNYLKKTGELWCVIRKDQGAESFIKLVLKEYKVEIIKKSKGFFIIKLKVLDN